MTAITKPDSDEKTKRLPAKILSNKPQGTRLPKQVCPGVGTVV
jgi:hypothetical protein